jgi:hypothetical protein
MDAYMVRTADGEAVFAGGEALVGALLGAADVAARAFFLGAGVHVVRIVVLNRPTWYRPAGS